VARSTKVHGWAIVASIAFHALLTGALSGVAYRAAAVDPPDRPAPDDAPPAPSAIVVELPGSTMGDVADESATDPAGQPPRLMAGDTVARMDTGTPGHGGDSRASVPALNLADGNEHMRLSPDLLSRLDRDQLQRLRVARARESWEDRRSTTHPAELTLVATGMGTVRERRPNAAREPARGALRSAAPSARGSSFGAEPVEGPGGIASPGGFASGAGFGAPGLGLLGARVGADHRTSAPVASARPSVVAGPVAVPANERGLPRDNVESEQEVATTVQSLVHASTAGGLAGQGEGGSSGGGEAGVGASRGSGSTARPLGYGEGDVYDYWTSDPRLLPYFRQIHRKIDPLWADAFPKSAMLELKQGIVILEITVSSDGRASVAWPPLRPSGVDEFDRNCAEAVRRASPLPPIPRELGVSSLRIRAPFEAKNPVVK